MNIILLHKGTLLEFSFNSIYKQNLPNHSFKHAMLYYPTNKVSASIKKEWLESNTEVFNNYDVILVSDADYFKIMAKQRTAESCLGNIYDSPFTSAKVMYIPSHWAYTIDPSKHKPNIDFALKQLNNYLNGTFQSVGDNIVHSEHYPITVEEIRQSLKELKQYPALTYDIEACSLNVTKAGIYTVSFAWDEHNGVAFPVDAIPEQSSQVRGLLKEFFEEYTGKLIVHKANYDVAVSTFTLFQNQDITDIKQQLNGLHHLTKNLEDTLLITYLATNSCAGNTLGLKDLAQPFAGKWAVDVSDVTKVGLSELLRYNLIDCLSTWYVYKKYYPIMQTEQQEDLYKTFMLPVLKDNIRMQLNGLPINLEEVTKLKESLILEKEQLLNELNQSKYVLNAQYLIAERATELRNSKLKTKVTTIEDNIQPFNFNSPNQLNTLLYEVLGLPVIDFTKTKKPATGKKTLAKLIKIIDSEEKAELLQKLIEYADVEKIQSAFIPAFESAHVDKNGDAHLMGYFNLAGTVSGRLSSSDVNLQQLPSTGSRFAKPVKKCFRSTKKWIFVGIDFASLEDRISALTTKDPNKLDVYLKGYDGHCLRAFAYYKHKMPLITEQMVKAETDEQKVEIINSIDKHPLYGDLRQRSKNPTFALTYKGTYVTLMRNLGFTEEEAKAVEASYHQLYKVSDEWVNNRIKQACIDGYVTTGFGLRVRTPILKQTIYSNNMPAMAQAEARTAGNALGQGWGVLNDRAMREVLSEIDRLGLSERILPVAKIHDACYYLIENDIELLNIINKLTVKAAHWNNHPEIYHPEVGLGGQLDVFYPSWANALTLPESCSQEELERITKDYQDSLN